MDTFSITLREISNNLQERRREGVSKIWVQGVNGSLARLVLTVFFNNHSTYQMRFIDIRNFRHVKIEDSEELRNSIIDGYVELITRNMQDFVE
jgi:hypothetical protein